jgi:hypothetical protein
MGNMSHLFLLTGHKNYVYILVDASNTCAHLHLLYLPTTFWLDCPEADVPFIAVMG